MPDSPRLRWRAVGESAQHPGFQSSIDSLNILSRRRRPRCRARSPIHWRRRAARLRRRWSCRRCPLVEINVLSFAGLRLDLQHQRAGVRGHCVAGHPARSELSHHTEIPTRCSAIVMLWSGAPHPGAGGRAGHGRTRSVARGYDRQPRD